MTVAIETLEKVGIVVVGGLVRLGIFLAVVAALAVPLVVAGWAINLVRERRRRTLGLHDVAGVSVRPGLHYAPGHTWLHQRGQGALELGVDDLALRLLPAVTAVEAQRIGSRVERGDVVATLWGGGRQLAIRAPVAGRLAGVNSAVVHDPSLVKRDGYGRGWLVALQPADDSWAQLPVGPAADGWMASEARRWNRMLEQGLGIAAADGGELVSPAPWIIGDEGWLQLASAFLDPR